MESKGFLSRNKESLAFGLALISIVSTGMGATWFLKGEFSEIHTTVEQIQHDVEEFDKDRYTLTMASEKALREAIANPGHKIPDPREPSKLIVVDLERNMNATD